MGLVRMQMKHDVVDTPLSNVFIDEYMPYANAAFSLVYIMGFRQCYHGNAHLTCSDLAASLGVSEEFVKKAWKYWATEGIVKILDDSDDTYQIEFIKVSRKKEETQNQKNVAIVEPGTGTGNDTDTDNDKPPLIRVETQPSYSVEELTLYTNRSEDARALFSMAQKMFGKPLSYNEMNVLLSFYDWLCLPLCVIEVMLDYCISNDHRNMRYIEKVALDWADNQISSIEEAEDYITLYNNDYREILKSFGQYRRDPAPKEIVFMKKWLKEYKMPLLVAKEACEKTILQIGQVKFSYADKIITEWYENEVLTLDDIRKYEIKFKKEKELLEKESFKGQKKTTSKFVNYDSRKTDYDALEKLEQQYLIKSLGAEKK